MTGVYVHGRAAEAAGTAPDLVAIDLIGALHPTLDALRSGHDPWGGLNAGATTLVRDVMTHVGR